ncbi:MAG: hypothetical protein E2O68_02085 [Deltaproteobacteria bacterium]|nr:MAG: hypothetical protein E2O68_02085 [Deltaproteobacteria bacterium]
MYVCICNKITDEMIKEYSAKGKSGLEMLKRLGLGSNCGICLLDKFHSHHSAEKADLKKSLKKSNP